MKTKLSFAALVLIFYCSATGLCAGNAGARPSITPQILKAGFNSGTFSASSPAFMENKGQVRGFDGSLHPEVKFEFKQGNTSLFLLERGIAYQFTNIHFPEGYAELLSKRARQHDPEKLQALQKQIRTETFRMDMTLIGANTNAKITTEGKSEDYVNFYNFNVLDVRSFSAITYHDIYPGIDWVIYTKNGQVKYDFVVKPGSNPALINMQFTHQEDLSLSNDGGFTLRNSLGSITETKPISYQGEKAIPTGFILKHKVISFHLGAYNRHQPLVIDPAVNWGTYYGGPGVDYGTACSTDAFGNVFLAGYTNNQSTPAIASGGYQNTFGGAMDAYLVKFNNSGQRQWSTYYGGSGAEYGYTCAADALGNVYLAGCTYQGAGPGIATAGSHQQNYGGGGSDAFLVKFDGSGNRLWGTYYGASTSDVAWSCATDAAGNVFLAGGIDSSAVAPGTMIATAGSHQQLFGGSRDAFLAKFNNAGVRQWGTYYGGAGLDWAFSCAADASGNVFLAGSTVDVANSGTALATSGSHQPAFGGTRDMFLVKFDPAGQRQWGTFYGGPNYEDGWSCATDALGNIFVTGTSTANIGTVIATPGCHQLTNGGENDAFLVKFNGSGVRQWGTFYGGVLDDNGMSCSTDNAGNVYLSGASESTNAIATGGPQANLAWWYDGFLAMFSSSGVRQWGTYYGGFNDDEGQSCATDALGHVYLAGTTLSSSGIALGGHQNTMGGVTYDGFLVQFCSLPPAQPSAISGNILVCQGSSYNYSVPVNASTTNYVWALPGGWLGASSVNTITALAGASGVLTVSAVNGCGVSPSQTINITANPKPVISASDGTICIGESFVILPSGADSYTISGGTTTVTPSATTAYFITGTSLAGCVSDAAVLNVFVSLCTSINEEDRNSGVFQVFPNPNTGSFEFRVATPAAILIYNGLGQKVWANDRVMPGAPVRVQGLASGSYLAHILSEGGSAVRKIIVISE